jgi:hypothetical protein
MRLSLETPGAAANHAHKHLELPSSSDWGMRQSLETPGATFNTAHKHLELPKNCLMSSERGMRQSLEEMGIVDETAPETPLAAGLPCTSTLVLSAGALKHFGAQRSTGTFLNTLFTLYRYHIRMVISVCRNSVRHGQGQDTGTVCSNSGHGRIHRPVSASLPE